MKYIDLCCGIGGFHRAMEKLEMECVMACDIDKDCRQIYEQNYGINPRGDLKEIDIQTIPDFDVLCAGFPCQPFSKAGQQQGFNDDRGNIFFDICEIIKHHKPKYIILENVRNLASHDKGNTWKVIKKKINELGYFTYENPVILNTLYFGVPQSRERVVILCKRKDLGNLKTLPIIDKKQCQKTAIETIIEQNENGVYQNYKLNEKMKATKEIWNDFLIILNNNNIPIPRFPIWIDWWIGKGEGTSVTKTNPKLSASENQANIQESQDEFYKKYKNWIDKNRKFYKDNKTLLETWLKSSIENPLWVGAVRKMEWQCGENNLNMSQVLWSARGSGIRIKKLDYAPTLVAMASMIPVYGPQNRHLTTRECARLQSFPENHIIHPNQKIAYKQFGNAVNVKMIEKSAQFLIYDKDLFQ